MVRFQEALERVRLDGMRARRALWPAGRYLDWPYADLLSATRPVQESYLSTVLGSVLGPPLLTWYMPGWSVTGGYQVNTLDVAGIDWVVERFAPPSFATYRDPPRGQ